MQNNCSTRGAIKCILQNIRFYYLKFLDSYNGASENQDMSSSTMINITLLKVVKCYSPCMYNLTPMTLCMCMSAYHFSLLLFLYPVCYLCLCSPPSSIALYCIYGVLVNVLVTNAPLYIQSICKLVSHGNRMCHI